MADNEGRRLKWRASEPAKSQVANQCWGANVEILTDGRFVRHPGAYRRYESAWSCLAKFAYQNRFGLGELVGLLANRTDAGRPVAWGRLQQDLNTPKGFNLDSIAKMLEVDRVHVDEMFTDHWTFPKYPPITDHLRYCPRCIENGFHTALFQYELLEKCPIHRILLNDRCPRCSKFIPYRLDKQTTETPYGCPCGELLWKGIEKWPWYCRGRQHSKSSWSEYLAWKKAVENAINKWERVLEVGFGERSSFTNSNSPSEFMIEYWAQYHLRPPDRLRRSFRVIPKFHTAIYSAGGLGQSPDAQVPQTVVLTEDHLERLAERYISEDCVAVLKAVNRRIKRKLLVSHRPCLARSYTTVKRWGAVSRYVFSCPWHDAYLRWHSQWFNGPLNYSAQFFTLSTHLDQFVRRWSGLVGSIDEMPWVRWIARRVLAESAIADFANAVTSAIREGSEGDIMLRTRLTIDRDASPYFHLYGGSARPNALFVSTHVTLAILDQADSVDPKHGGSSASSRSKYIVRAAQFPDAEIETLAWRL